MTVQLSELAKKRIELQPTPLLYGKTAPFTVTGNSTGTTGDTVIPISLLRITNEVNINIGWKRKDGQPCPLWEHADNTRIYIEDTNGIYDFGCIQQPTDEFTYIPRYLTGSHSEGPNKDLVNGFALLRTHATVMRLFPDSTPRLRICRVLPDGSEQDVYVKDLMADFIGKIYGSQETLDRWPAFDINITFDCEDEASSWAAIDITVNGWKLEDGGNVDIE